MSERVAAYVTAIRKALRRPEPISPDDDVMRTFADLSPEERATIDEMGPSEFWAFLHQFPTPESPRETAPPPGPLRP